MQRFTFSSYIPDMGSFNQPGCRSWEDALWHLNDAREHDNLPALTLGELASLSKVRNSTQFANLIPEH